MKIYLTKVNIITIAITLFFTLLFVAWGIYLMRDKPIEIPVEPTQATTTEPTAEELFELLQEYRATVKDATTTGPLEILD